PGTGSAFPIIDGVPVMIPSAFPRGFLDKHAAMIKELPEPIKIPFDTGSADDFSFSSEWQGYFDHGVNRKWGWTLVEPIEQLLMEMEVGPEWFRGKTILDAGCGPGDFTEAISELGANVVGFDYASAVHEAERRRRSRTLQFVRGDISKASLKDESFDAVLS